MFYGAHFSDYLQSAAERTVGATVFAYQVRDPERYGVIELDVAGNVLSLEEKPARPKSSYTVTGLYFYDNHGSRHRGWPQTVRARRTRDYRRQSCLCRRRLHVEELPRGVAWLDTGTHEALMQASNYIHAIQERQGLMVACLEEIAYRKGYISAADLARLARAMDASA